MSHIRELMKTEPLETLHQLKKRNGDDWAQPLTMVQINSALLAACEEIEELEKKLADNGITQ